MQIFLTTERASNNAGSETAKPSTELAQNYLPTLTYADIFWKPYSVAFKYKISSNVLIHLHSSIFSSKNTRGCIFKNKNVTRINRSTLLNINLS